MKKCGDCIHADICKQVNGSWFSPENIAYCRGFKDRTKYVEVVHGRWISLTKCSNAGVYCSVCNKKVWKEDYAFCNRKNKLRSNYCPNCGAKMDLEGKNDTTDI